MKVILLSLVLLVLSNSFAQSANDERIELILKAFNTQPESIVKPLVASDIEIGEQDGRVTVNQETKFSYYIHIKRSKDRQSPLTLIPMATSRFTPTYYQSNDWWDDHKNEIAKAKAEGRPVPRQDLNEVAQWLLEMKLTSNPDVIMIEPSANRVERVPLQEFLLDHYLKHYEKEGFVTLFRGAEKADEIDSWNKKETPQGVRYWTPTANYAWRYARKNLHFLDKLIENKTPLFKFKIPIAIFRDMVRRRWPQLTLGTELTKNAHQTFNRNKSFQDHLTPGQAYLGEGRFGVEFEVRSNRAGAMQMASYYVGPVTIEDLATDRIRVLQLTMDRLIENRPEARNQITRNFTQRIEQVSFESRILIALNRNYSNEVVMDLMAQKPSGSSELTNIDGLQLESWVQQKLAKREIPQLHFKPKKCGSLFL